MTERMYLLISGSVFAIVGFLHLLRILSQSSIQVGTLGIPLWLSGFAIIAASALSIWAFRLAKHISNAPSVSH